jgi:protein phosphatase
VTYAGITDPGRVRRYNEDGLLLLTQAGVFAVADGLGGLDAGEVASSTVLQSLKELYTSPVAQDLTPLPPHCYPPLETIIATVNTRTYQKKMALGNNMATTLAMVQLCGATATIAHVGDSRVYHGRNDALERVTSDHSLVNELYEQRALTASQAELSPQRHVLTRAIGAGPTVAPSVQQRTVFSGDILLLCTDGLTGMLPETKIAKIIRAWRGDIGQAVQHLVQAANAAGGQDNITVVLLALNGPG